MTLFVRLVVNVREFSFQAVLLHQLTSVSKSATQPSAAAGSRSMPMSLAASSSKPATTLMNLALPACPEKGGALTRPQLLQQPQQQQQQQQQLLQPQHHCHHQKVKCIFPNLFKNKFKISPSIIG